MTWRDTNEKNVKAAVNALPQNLPFFQRGWMVLISGGHSHTPADIKDVSAGGEIFTHTGTVRISGDGKRPSPGLLIVLETTTTDDQYQREQAVRNAVRRADKIITSLTFIPSH
jgi:hypothetical protein